MDEIKEQLENSELKLRRLKWFLNAKRYNYNKDPEYLVSDESERMNLQNKINILETQISEIKSQLMI